MERPLNFAQLISPVSLAILGVSTYMTWIAVFQPSLAQILMLLCADVLGTVLANAVDKPIYYRIDPVSRIYFPKIDHDAIAKLGLSEKCTLFDSLIKFPARRSSYTTWMSFFKAIPLFVLAMFIWEHNDPLVVPFLKVLALTSVTFAYFYSASVLEKHQLASDAIAQFHKLHDWSDVFRLGEVPQHDDGMRAKEGLSMFSIWLFVMATEWIVITSHDSGSTLPLATQVSLIAFSGLMLSFRVWYIERRYFVGGLQALFVRFKKFDPTNREVLPLHSTPVLAKFEKTFNEMNERLTSHERELSQWIVTKTEESRYTALGEIAGLVVHDLSSPLHVINFCTRQLRDNPQLIRNERYLDQLTINGERSLELITSIRAYLKSSKAEAGTADFGEAMKSVRKLCDTRFFSPAFERIRFEVDPALDGLLVKISRPNLIHVLINLLSNSIQNLLEHDVKDPVIEVELGDAAGVFHIKDNGTGLSAAEFEKLTAFAYLSQDGQHGQTGLGMKLVRRLVEQHGGSLQVIDQPGRRGTVFVLKIAVVDANQEQSKGASLGS